jgi:hypothetical protein
MPWERYQCLGELWSVIGPKSFTRSPQRMVRSSCRPDFSAKSLPHVLLTHSQRVSQFEAVHPLEGGAFRVKFRRDRRYGMPLESPILFYARYVAETTTKAWHYLAAYRDARRTLRQVLRAADRWTYTDLAIAPPHEDELDRLDLYRATSGGEAAVARVRREAEARARVVGELKGGGGSVGMRAK